MNAYFARHDRDTGDPGEWLSWGGDSGRVWASKVAQRRRDRVTATVSEKLADDDEIDYDTLRLLPRAFSMLNGPHTAECDGNGSCSCGGSKSSARYPSSRALTYLALGGDAGRDWARRTIRRVEAEALLAAGYDADANVVAEEEVPEAESFDGDAPHVYAPVIEQPRASAPSAAPARWTSGTRPTRSTTPRPTSPPRTRTTSPRPSRTPTSARSAARPSTTPCTSRRRWRTTTCTRPRSTRRSPRPSSTGRARPARASSPRSRSPRRPRSTASTGRSSTPTTRSSRRSRSTTTSDTLFWERRGTEDDDPLTYYAAYTGDDSMMVDQLYVSDGAMFYRYDPVAPDLGADPARLPGADLRAGRRHRPRGRPGAVDLPRPAGRPARGRPRRGAGDAGGHPRPRRRDAGPGRRSSPPPA